jgi:hypothetical protein
VEAEFERIAPEFVAQHPRSESATRLATAGYTQTARDVVFIRGAGGTRTRDQRITKSADPDSSSCCSFFLVRQPVWSLHSSGMNSTIPVDSRSLAVNKR